MRGSCPEEEKQTFVSGIDSVVFVSSVGVMVDRSFSAVDLMEAFDFFRLRVDLVGATRVEQMKFIQEKRKTIHLVFVLVLIYFVYVSMMFVSSVFSFLVDKQNHLDHHPWYLNHYLHHYQYNQYRFHHHLLRLLRH